jgi:hypothetical protein
MIRVLFFLNIFFIFYASYSFAEEEANNDNFYISKAEFDIDQKIFINSDYAFQKSDETFFLKQINAIQKRDDNKNIVIKSKTGTIDNKNKIVLFYNGTIALNKDLIIFKSAKINVNSENIDNAVDVKLKSEQLEIKSDSANSTKDEIFFKKNVETTIKF